ncbi:DNA polymerase alpha catalytic subunit [Blattella germanica]|nr:DNA polymerase alpha catalytic subunit [Blattella germanica]
MNTDSETDEEVKMMDVYKEFNDKIATKYKILQFKSRKVERNYAFNIRGVPLSSEYLEVLYPAVVEKPEHVTLCSVVPLPPLPPLVVATLNMRTALNPNNGQNEIVMLSCLVHNSFYIDKPPPRPPFEQHFCSEYRNVLSRTLLGGRSERNEFLLLHAFSEKNFIVPDKQYGKKPIHNVEELDMDDAEEEQGKRKKNASKRKPAYTGGLVLEPRVGFYDKMILLMDFNSLYPSIIQEYNICFTTINLGAIQESKKGEGEDEIDLPSPGMEPGILPTEIRKLVQSRREVKKLMKASDISDVMKMQYNIRQMALKLTANSMYGCLGFSHSRFYARPLAALVTAKGREILMNTKDLVEKMNYHVIYGDTDSIMISTNSNEYDQVFKIGNKIKAEINKLYKQVELDIDGVFKYMLLLKKKKYAAVTISRLPNGDFTTNQELKDFGKFASSFHLFSMYLFLFRYILNQILSDLEADERIFRIHERLERIKIDLENGRVPLSLLTITKQLTKNPEDYADKKSLPHVQIAVRLNEQHGGRRFRQGDTVSYVICEDGTSNSAIQRAYHLDEKKANESLKIDCKYYLSQQIHPVVCRLVEPIEGTDAAQIAHCLGLDPSGYQTVQRGPPNLELEKAYDKLREQAERTLQYSAYSVVDLGQLFQPLLWEPKTEDQKKTMRIYANIRK